MSLRAGNRFFEAGDYDKAIHEYMKIGTDSSLYQHAQSNIARARGKLKDQGAGLEAQVAALAQIGTFEDTFPKVDNGWSAIITLWKRADYLEEQLEAISHQTIPPNEIILIQNESHFVVPDKLVDRFGAKLIKSGINSLYARWIVGYLCNSKYVCVFDDDVIPGQRWIELCVDVSNKYNALVGPSGRRARPDVEPAWVSVEGVKSGKDELCDWVCNSYFFRTEWVKYIVAVPRYSGYHKTFDDIQLATSLKVFGGINTVVPGYQKTSSEYNGHVKREYGHDENALWKRQASEHAVKRSEFIRAIDRTGFQWVGK